MKMVKIVDGNLFDSKANFIAHQVNCQGVMGAGVAAQVADKFPHVESEYRKYLRYCKKNRIEALGTVQYVPSESWALIMVNTMKNKDVIAYDENYQYIVNLFGQYDCGNESTYTDLDAVKSGFIDIKEKAIKIGATVAMPYMIGSFRGGANWNDVYNIIQEVFSNDVEVEICRYDNN